jgi:hypothetical protein
LHPTRRTLLSIRHFRARRTVVGSGWRLKLPQLEANGSIGEVCSIEAAGVAAAHMFPPVLFIVWSNLSPGQAFLQGPDGTSVSAI